MKLSQRKAQASGMSPLLRSIAREIVERTAVIARLESRLGAIHDEALPSRQHARRLAPRLAGHRRELRLAEAELKRLGWVRDEAVPLRFCRCKDATEWRPGESFHRMLDISW